MLLDTSSHINHQLNQMPADNPKENHSNHLSNTQLSLIDIAIMIKYDRSRDSALVTVHYQLLDVDSNSNAVHLRHKL